jgi:hypothetical protein
MHFHVKCVRCGRVARISFLDSVSTNCVEEASLESNFRLNGYLVDCPACEELRGLRNPPVSVRTEVTAILADALRRSA